MLTDNRHNGIPAGDFVSHEEALADTENDLEARIELVVSLVEKKVATLPEALTGYGVSPLEYFAYGVLKNKPAAVLFSDEKVIIAFISEIADTVNKSHLHLQQTTQRVITDMRNLNTTR